MRLAEGVADLHFWDRQAGRADLHWVSIHLLLRAKLLLSQG